MCAGLGQGANGGIQPPWNGSPPPLELDPIQQLDSIIKVTAVPPLFVSPKNILEKSQCVSVDNVATLTDLMKEALSRHGVCTGAVGLVYVPLWGGGFGGWW